MATMNVSLPDKMREWIDQQVATGRYANASDLVRDLIREAIGQSEFVTDVRQALAEGDASGYLNFNTNKLREHITKMKTSDAA